VARIGSYSARNSKIPRKFPFLGQPIISLSPWKGNPRSAMNLIVITIILRIFRRFEDINMIGVEEILSEIGELTDAINMQYSELSEDEEPVTLPIGRQNYTEQKGTEQPITSSSTIPTNLISRNEIPLPVHGLSRIEKKAAAKKAWY
jgi:hypothetical protein